jgi:LacI family transcriptional regulator
MEGPMGSAQSPTAVLTLNLGISTGVLLDRIADHRDLAFIALDGNELPSGLGTSAIIRDPREVGRQAALLAVERLRRPQAPPRTVAVPCTLARRGSGELPAPQRSSGDTSSARRP